MSIRPTNLSFCPNTNAAVATFQGLSLSDMLVCKDTSEKTTNSYQSLMQEWESLLPKSDVVFMHRASDRKTLLSLPPEVVLNIFSFIDDAGVLCRFEATCRELFRLSISNHASELLVDRLKSKLELIESSEAERRKESLLQFNMVCDSFQLACDNYDAALIASSDYEIQYALFESSKSTHDALNEASLKTVSEFRITILFAEILSDKSRLLPKQGILMSFPKSDS